MLSDPLQIYMTELGFELQLPVFEQLNKQEAPIYIDPLFQHLLQLSSFIPPQNKNIFGKTQLFQEWIRPIFLLHEYVSETRRQNQRPRLHLYAPIPKHYVFYFNFVGKQQSKNLKLRSVLIFFIKNFHFIISCVFPYESRTSNKNSFSATKCATHIHIMNFSYYTFQQHS